MLQDLRLSEEVVEKLHKADQRFCGSADQVLARLRGTLFYGSFSLIFFSLAA
jgi:eukaryotic translation initiation factor 2-alpha kinase 4